MHYTRPRNVPSLEHGLTVRERLVLALLARGLSPLEIAWRLGVKVATVAGHLSRICARLHCYGPDRLAQVVGWWRDNVEGR